MPVPPASRPRPLADDADDATLLTPQASQTDVADDDDAYAELLSGVVIAIDGPAGSGKSSVARAVAHRLGVAHLDTGALYRSAALACLEAGVDLADEQACASTAAGARIAWRDGRASLDDADVEDRIRGEDVTAAVSQVSAHPAVRNTLLEVQRAMLRDGGGVLEGRDIGTVVAPEADVKVFLTASVQERARRRAEQLGRADVEVLAAQIAVRDASDENRDTAPLAAADDAWVLDTSGLELADVIESVVERVHEVLAGVDGDAAAAVTDPFAANRALPRVAVVGRPNVGKSTLVNRVLGDRVAIVEEKPGVTRDRTEHQADWAGRDFLVVDTGGWEHRAQGMAASIVAQAERAIAEADVVLFVVDGVVGALEDDERYARLLRRSDTPTVLVANKIDGDRQEAAVHELYTLGLGEPHPVSARHGRGVGDLLDEVIDALGDRTEVEHVDDGVPRVAIVGKPNVGKSSLFNLLLGEDRSIVDAVPHTTRDAVDTMVEVDGEPWVFVDTAGMRRKYRHGEDTELYSVDRTRRAVEESDLVLFVVDASEPLGEQDQRLAALLREAGRGFVLVCNKWDLIDADRHDDFERELDRLLSFAAWAPRVNVSAHTGRAAHRVMPQLRLVWENYRRRIPTRVINTVVQEAVAMHPLPRKGNRPLQIRYATQAEAAPPRVLLFSNGKLPDSYRRYIERILRERFDFTGVPLAIDDRPRTKRERGRGRARGRVARR